jgi:hypothetical protein
MFVSICDEFVIKTPRTNFIKNAIIFQSTYFVQKMTIKALRSKMEFATLQSKDRTNEKEKRLRQIQSVSTKTNSYLKCYTSSHMQHRYKLENFLSKTYDNFMFKMT